jgi:hypothetical protein
MTLRRHVLLLASLAACGPGGGKETETLDSDTLATFSGSDTSVSASSPTDDPSVSSDPTNPTATLPTNPSDPTITTDPTNPTITTDPTTPTLPTNPSDPSDPTATVTTVQPTTLSTTDMTASTADTDSITNVTISASDPDTSNSDTFGTFIVPPDDVPQTECDIFAENCPQGQKCMPFANDGENSWNDLMCVPIAANPRQPGDVCNVKESGVSGFDDCDIHSMCFNVDPDTLQGTCVAMCTGSEQNPMCPPGSSCTIANDGVLVLCLPTCDPLDPGTCAADQVCVFVNDDFLCVFDASGNEGQMFDECEFVNDCDSGLACVDASGVPQCDPQAPGCCTDFCDLELPNMCPPPLACVPFFEEGQAPPGLEDVGLCVVP